METLSAAEVSRRYPAFQIPENYTGLFDAQAGWIDVDASIASSHAYARRLGVECRFDQPVVGWEASASEVRVHLAKESVTAGHLIVTAGAWTGDLLRALELPLRLKRKVIAWFDPAHPEFFAADRIPVFTFPDNSIYGFPDFPGLGVKLAEHEGGSYVPDAEGPIAPPGAEDLDPIAAAVARYMPKLAGSFREAQSRLVRSTTCLYTMTPDEDFLVDRHPQYNNVVFAAGFSGHGFKFAPLIAVALADLVLDGKTQLPIEFLSRNRLLAQFEQPNRSR
jgi:glycine/D-amino acid oxidase-like deaminating enzyme